jgi:hypothetical protein
MDDETFAAFIRLMKKHWENPFKWKVVAEELNRWILANGKKSEAGDDSTVHTAAHFSNVVGGLIGRMRDAAKERRQLFLIKQ